MLKMDHQGRVLWNLHKVELVEHDENGSSGKSSVEPV
jgi:hypothetical protein